MNSSTRLLQLIGESGDDGATLDALSGRLEDLSRKAIVMAAGVLSQRGLLERPAPGRYRLNAAGRLALANSAEIKSGPRGTHATAVQAHSLRAGLWRGMRAMGKFGLDDLLLRAASGDEADAHNNAIKYLNVLERAGYLVRMKHRLQGSALTSPGFVRWLLVRNTGPKAPVWQHQKDRVFDPNTRDVYPLAPAQEASHV